MSTFKPGDIVWAKMKGFPPWPAKILQAQSAEVPPGRFSVVFFGTKETAIMKASDLFEYTQHRKQFEVPRKQKGFTEAIREAQCAAGLSGPQKPEASHGNQQRQSISPFGGRSRRPSSKLNVDDFVVEPFERKRTGSHSSRRSRTSSISSQKAKAKPQRRGSKTPERGRLDSGDSVQGRRKRTFSAGFDIDQFDAGNDPMFSPMLSDGVFNSMLDGLEADMEVDPHPRYSKRTPKSKLFDDFVLGKTPTRERTSSTSSSCRTRLISGVSDVFEELLESAQSIFNPADLLSAIDNLPSEDDRPVTPEEPLPMPAPTKCCAFCGCVCELYGLKWRCTGKSCLKWNGTHDPFGKDGELMVSSSTPNNSESSHKGFAQLSDSADSSPPCGLAGAEAAKPDNDAVDVTVQAASQDSSHFIKEPKSAAVTASTRAKSAFVSQQPENDNSIIAIPSTSSDPHPTAAASASQQPFQSSVVANPISNGAPPLFPRRQLGSGRPKSYKVEKTPPVAENGQRHCAFCGGQVRPQMCGGNKHRWRCVDKKCRKWYGWVRSNEEIPKDLGKKGRWKDLALKIRMKKVSGEDDDSSDHPTSSAAGVPHSQNALITAALPLCEKQPKKLGRPPKMRGKVKLKPKKGALHQNSTERPTDGERPKRKYTKRDQKAPVEAASASRCSPLPFSTLTWRPSAMEKRVRWWTSEKRPQNPSPEREWNPNSMLDVAAAMRIIGNSMMVAAHTRADEPGSVSGCLDLLMDTLMSSIGPLISLTAQIPQFGDNREVLQRMWDASAIHTPIFP